MAWFKRRNKGIQTPTQEKKDIPKGLWYKSPTGKVIDTDELQKNFYVSNNIELNDLSNCNIVNGSVFINGEYSLTTLEPLKNIERITKSKVNNCIINPILI